jgi:hypothetical protein
MVGDSGGHLGYDRSGLDKNAKQEINRLPQSREKWSGLSQIRTGELLRVKQTS